MLIFFSAAYAQDRQTSYTSKKCKKKKFWNNLANSKTALLVASISKTSLRKSYELS